MDKDFQKAIKAQFGKDVEVYTWQEVRDAFKKFNYTREDAIKFIYLITREFVACLI